MSTDAQAEPIRRHLVEASIEFWHATRVTWRRNTATSWRKMRISTFLAAALPVSSASQPNSL
jgi:hypothetical protein